HYNPGCGIRALFAVLRPPSCSWLRNTKSQRIIKKSGLQAWASQASNNGEYMPTQGSTTYKVKAKKMQGRTHTQSEIFKRTSMRKDGSS
ncbi:hypothetical protein S83_054801, partial [Arachis hypogaea]